MQRLQDMRSKIPGLPLPGRSAQGGSNNDTAYEPYRNQHSPPNDPQENYGRSNATYLRKRKPDSRGSKIVRFISCLIAIALAAGIVSMAARIVVILDSTTNTRLMWPYGMMLKAWPPGGMLAVSTYLMLATGAMALLVNGVLMMLLCVRRGDNGSTLFSGVFAIIVRSTTTATLITAVVLDAVAKPNLRSWSCVSKQFEQDFRDNTIGFESVCFDLTVGFAATVALAAIELLNVAFAMWSRIKNRRSRNVRVWFASAPRTYDKLETFGKEDDEIPMLDVDQRGQMQ